MSKRGTTIVCSFSVGIDELPRKVQRDAVAVARVIAKHGRFSVFEATANQTIARTVDRIWQAGWFEETDPPAAYPWTRVRLTEAGKRALEEAP